MTTEGEASARSRVIIEGVEPEIDCGRFPAKAVVGDPFVVEADVFADGHDALRCLLLYRGERQRKWRTAEMELLGNDRWEGHFTPDEPGRCHYTLLAWIDTWGSWVRDLRKRIEAGQDVEVDLRIGAGILDGFARPPEGAAARQAEAIVGGGPSDADREAVRALAERLRDTADALADPDPGGEADAADLDALLDALLDDLEGDEGAAARRADPRRHPTRHVRALEVQVDRERGVRGAWYEFFPRSTGPEGEHGTFETAMPMLEYVADMGFDIVYLPPVHPIGTTKRKGPNNRPEASPGDHGSPWAIGGRGAGGGAGGHTALHPELGDFDDFARFRERAEELGLELALDVAFQVSPDHPWVAEHPEWFRHRPDGTVQYAENPPKKYEDIYPIDFDTEEWRELWKELRGVFEFWMERGVRIFRVDNPHTKSLRFWAWCIPELRRRDPGVVFLSEAFTRPRLMYHLAKLGFTQSYTYFAWRTGKHELRSYMEELTRSEVRHFFRPNFWPNTPDILTETLQHGGRPAFAQRLVLAATLTASYGIYGPAFELLEHRPRSPGSEEYLDSEKYQLRAWDLEREDSLRDFIARVNRIRRENPALHRNRSLHFHETDNDQLLAYSKREGDNRVLVVVNLDPLHRQTGWVDVDLAHLGIPAGEAYAVRDLLSDARYGWQGRHNYVELDPHVVPAHVFRVERPGEAEAAATGETAEAAEEAPRG